ncbi:calcium/sodium antiporter [Maribellus sp. YY47]|uniref:calcium/sodium antiporter n=1 Tax=Maribellus sp. YY47 TaxID=2929486 RepID=UPI002000A4FE|nr:calcium/sodium antiporter [Maribellus sp. YY47]MCK3684241.1 calcium/sodium antiporter [Maribellus sp. YY47]
MILLWLLILAGFAVLILGANWLVDGASALAKKYRVSDLAIGLTIVAFGTSAPELVVNLVASSKGLSDIVLGNIVGSNNFNLFVILGISGLLYPITVQSSTAWREIPLSIAVLVLLIFLANNFFIGSAALSRIDGVILLALFFGFLYYVFRQMKAENPEESKPVEYSVKKIVLYIVLGLAGLIAGGQLVVNNSVKVASLLGVSEKIIGLTIIAAGTSLPELTTSVVAALKRNSDIAIGNVIGSNIFNVLLVLGASVLIRPVKYAVSFNTDLAIITGGTVFLFVAMLTGKRKTLDRWEAALLLVFFMVYTVFLFQQEIG